MEGFLNKIFKKVNVEEVFVERLHICSECPEIDIDGQKCLIPGTEPCCGVCGCSLGIKLRSMSTSCPLESPKWKAVMTEQEEDKLTNQ